MSSIRDVARAAGVSVATVSRALATPEKVSNASLKKVKEAVESIGYKPNLMARSFRSARAYAIVVLVPDITNPFFSTVIQAIGDVAQTRGYAVLLGDTRESSTREQEYVNRVETRLADGVIQLRPQSMSLSASDIPWVNACGCIDTPTPSVRIDNIKSARTMVDYLLSLGHQRIGVISGLPDNPHAIERLEGYRQSIATAGLTFEEDLVAYGDFTMQSGQEAAHQFYAMADRPTAVYCMNDQMAMGAIQTFKSKGIRIPQEMSVTGFDDIHYAQYWDPGLTTVAQPADEIGRIAAEMLLNIIEGQELPQPEVILPTQFIVRGSTTPIKLKAAPTA